MQPSYAPASDYGRWSTSTAPTGGYAAAHRARREARPETTATGVTLRGEEVTFPHVCGCGDARIRWVGAVGCACQNEARAARGLLTPYQFEHPGERPGGWRLHPWYATDPDVDAKDRCAAGWTPSGEEYTIRYACRHDGRESGACGCAAAEREARGLLSHDAHERRALIARMRNPGRTEDRAVQ